MAAGLDGWEVWGLDFLLDLRGGGETDVCRDAGGVVIGWENGWTCAVVRAGEPATVEDSDDYPNG